ncbi:DNA-dependent metalloprotease SPRTN isoform X1 [Pogona vitticeps]|uniref:DNA-dependent metalloprotease SPRTN n=1 Tax=Pogona vitticeps TaxID=103695 RepID=A0A6J0T8A3_9SAUR
MDEDFLLALRLQEEWEAQDGDDGLVEAVEDGAVSSSSAPRPLSVVDEAWELLDPNPDIRGLFLQFNETLFWGRLAAVEVKWSPRMTLCAGVCCYERHGGMCSIRLSEPLLKLRPRKDLVETLLHEMIHALLFVTNNDKDHDSHGPEFCKHMHRINRLTGANITIYHEFHDEVDSYRQHWWRCNGPCQHRKPYYGYVKRAMNRAPSANDTWWSEHQQTCGGTFTKIKEPENYCKKGKDKNQQPQFLADDKGRTPGCSIQSIIPFSGKGYVLGGKTSVSSSLDKPTSASYSKDRELLRSPHHSSPTLPRPNPRNEQNISCKTNSLPFFCSGDKNNFDSSLTLPKVSVANKKAYTNVNGSPLKNVSFNIGRSNKTTAWDLPRKGTSRKSISQPVASAHKSPTPKSQGNSPTQSGVPPKRARMENTVAFENYFLKQKDSGGTTPPVKSKAEPVALVTASVNDEERKVCCPVCQSEVLEAKINEHLDCCLSGFV